MPRMTSQSFRRSAFTTSTLQNLVRVIGIEPTRLAAPEPKSGASTNFATPAKTWRLVGDSDP